MRTRNPLYRRPYYLNLEIYRNIEAGYCGNLGHKLRSVLTLLGMIIGVMAVVVVYSLIQGFNTSVDEKKAGIGAKSFNVQRFNPLEDFKDTDTIAAAQRRNKDLTMEDFEYLKERATLIGKLGARARGTPSEIKRGDQTLEDVFVSGATAAIADIENRDIADGRFLVDAEDDAAQRVAYLGADVATKLFPAGNPLSQEISIRGIPYRVIGIEVARGSVFGIPQDNFVLIPLKTYANNSGGLIRQRSLYCVATSKNDDTLRALMKRASYAVRRKLGANEKDSLHRHAGCDHRLRDPYLALLHRPIAVPALPCVRHSHYELMLVSGRSARKHCVRKSGERRGYLETVPVEAVTYSRLAAVASIGG